MIGGLFRLLLAAALCAALVVGTTVFMERHPQWRATVANRAEVGLAALQPKLVPPPRPASVGKTVLPVAAAAPDPPAIITNITEITVTKRLAQRAVEAPPIVEVVTPAPQAEFADLLRKLRENRALLEISGRR